MNNNARKILLFLLMIIITSFAGKQTFAAIHGTHRYQDSCEPRTVTNPYGQKSSWYLYTNLCTISVPTYVPYSGYYKVKTKVVNNKTLEVLGQAVTTQAYLYETKPISEQEVTVSGSTVIFTVDPYESTDSCQILVDDKGNEYLLVGHGVCGEGTAPLPPTPPRPDTSCTINNGNPIDVDLKTLERSKLSTVVAKNDQAVVYPLTIDCTGGVSINLDMQMKFTPITIHGTQVIKTSAYGLGVGVFLSGAGYNDSIVQTSGTYSISIGEAGHTDLSLTFLPVSNPNVSVSDIPTGDFTASAVLVMTEQ